MLSDFLETYIYPQILDKDNLLAILTYGSSLTGFASNNSDIDLLIILNECDHLTRGVKFFKGKKVEYFIKPIEKFLDEAIKHTKNNCPSHVALEQNAYFLYDKGDFVKNILKSDAQFYNQNRQIPKDNFDLKLVQAENRLASLKNIYERNGKEFHMVYFNLLEMIRTLHSKRNDEANVPFAKAYRVYSDPNYYHKYVSNNADNTKPDPTFVELYTSCVNEYLNKEKMMSYIQALYDYEKQFYKINPEDYELNLE